MEGSTLTGVLTEYPFAATLLSTRPVSPPDARRCTGRRCAAPSRRGGRPRQSWATGGSTLPALQTRATPSTVAADPSGMACTVISKDQAHGYALTTTYVTDPRRDTVLMHTAMSALPGSKTNLASLHVYT